MEGFCGLRIDEEVNEDGAQATWGFYPAELRGDHMDRQFASEKEIGDGRWIERSQSWRMTHAEPRRAWQDHKVAAREKPFLYRVHKKSREGGATNGGGGEPLSPARAPAVSAGHSGSGT